MQTKITSENSEARSLGELVAARVTYHRQEQRLAFEARDFDAARSHGEAVKNWCTVAGPVSA